MKLKINDRKVKSIPICIYSLLLLCLFLGFFLGYYNIPGYFKANLKLLSQPHVINAMFQKNNLETIKLSISFKNYQKILDKRDEALRLGKLFTSSDDFVKAKLDHLDKSHNCKIRLKGDLSKHWNSDKLSLRVELKKGSSLKGMSSFSLQDPRTRQGTDEWLYLKALKEEGCMAVRYDFVNLEINGKKMGVYAIQEHFSKELIESNKRREGVILSFDEYLLWKKFPPYLSSNIQWNTLFKSSSVNSRNTKRIFENTSLIQQHDNATNLLRALQDETLTASKIFCTESLGKFLALTHLWQTEHALDIDDINFFYNPIISQLEPIGSDGQRGIYEHFCFFTSGTKKENWMNIALKDPLIAESYIKYLSKFSNKEYIDKIYSKFNKNEMELRKVLLCEYIGLDRVSIWKDMPKILNYDPWGSLYINAEKIRQELSESHLVVGDSKIEIDNENLLIKIRNTTTQPVEIIGFDLNNSHHDALPLLQRENIEKDFHIFNGNIVIMPRGINGWEDIQNFYFKIPEFSNHQITNTSLHVICKFLGNLSNPIKIKIPIDRYRFNKESIPIKNEENISSNLSNYYDAANNKVVITSGLHEFNKSVYIPTGLPVYILPGANLYFGSNATLVSQSPIFAIGTINEPVKFTATGKNWPGLLISNTEESSIFEHTDFSNVTGVGTGPNPSGLVSNGWTLTGGITIFKSEVSFNNCKFDNFQTEDALNIVDSKFSLDSCIFTNMYSDAFDGDFVNGTVSNSSFKNISGDGVDFSGSNIRIEGCTFKVISDKAISIGESSTALISNCSIDRTSFGVVSKDLSSTKVTNETLVSNYRKYAFAAFQKKPSFGSASIKVESKQFQFSQHDFLIQKESLGLLNGQLIKDKVFDASELYQN